MKLFVVLGMGRSGTSAITRGLQALGVSLGEKLMPPHAGYNDKGFFEDLDIHQMNEELLSALGSRWDAMPLIHPSEFKHDKLKEFRSRAVALLRAKLERGGGAFAFKDPRTARLMPFWREVFGHIQADVHYLLAFRHPMSVVKSLRICRVDSEKGFYLWLNNVTNSLLHTENQKRLVVDYDRLMEDAVTQLKRIAEKFSLVFDPDSPAVSEYTGQFLEERLRHTHYQSEDLFVDPVVQNDVIEIHHLMMQMARDIIPIDAPQVRQISLAVRERLFGMNPAFEYMEQLNQRLLRQNEEIADRDAQIASVNECISRMNEQISNLNQVLLEKENNTRELLQSIETWQRSWVKRAFHRWHPPGNEDNLGFFWRLQRSIIKRLDKIPLSSLLIPTRLRKQGLEMNCPTESLLFQNAVRSQSKQRGTPGGR